MFIGLPHIFCGIWRFWPLMICYGRRERRANNSGSRSATAFEVERTNTFGCKALTFVGRYSFCSGTCFFDSCCFYLVRFCVRLFDFDHLLWDLYLFIDYGCGKFLDGVWTVYDCSMLPNFNECLLFIINWSILLGFGWSWSNLVPFIWFDVLLLYNKLQNYIPKNNILFVF